MNTFKDPPYANRCLFKLFTIASVLFACDHLLFSDRILLSNGQSLLWATEEPMIGRCAVPAVALYSYARKCIQACIMTHSYVPHITPALQLFYIAGNCRSLHMLG